MNATRVRHTVYAAVRICAYLQLFVFGALTLALAHRHTTTSKADQAEIKAARTVVKVAGKSITLRRL
jgi:hypothetical protein